MEINAGVQDISALQEGDGGNVQNISQVEEGETFNQFLQQMDQLNSVENEAKQEMTDVVMGKSEHPHNAHVALEKASFQFEMASQIRDTSVQGFNQLFNLDV